MERDESRARGGRASPDLPVHRKKPIHDGHIWASGNLRAPGRYHRTHTLAAGSGTQPASLNGSLVGSNRDRKIAASIGSLKRYRTYAAHSSSTNVSNLPAYDSRKFTISLSSVAYALEELGNRFLTIFWLSQHAFDRVSSEPTTRDVDWHGIFLIENGRPRAGRPSSGNSAYVSWAPLGFRLNDCLWLCW